MPPLMWIGIVIFFILLSIMRQLAEGEDTWVTSITVSAGLTVCGMAAWLFIILAFIGKPLSALGLTLL